MGGEIAHDGTTVVGRAAKAAARTFDTVVDAVRDALLAVTPDDYNGYFCHCGYDATPN